MVKIPDKMFFRIGDVSRITDVKSYVLRYWESEFKSLRPVKNRAGQRVYRKKDVQLVLEIKKLLYDQKFTIAGAKKRIEELRRSSAKQVVKVDEGELRTLLKKVHKELSVINDILA